MLQRVSYIYHIEILKLPELYWRLKLLKTCFTAHYYQANCVCFNNTYNVDAESQGDRKDLRMLQSLRLIHASKTAHLKSNHCHEKVACGREGCKLEAV